MNKMSFNPNDWLIHHDIQTVIDLVNTLKQDHPIKEDRESIASMISAKTYLQDKRILEAILKEVNASKDTILDMLNQAIEKALMNNIEIIYEDNPEWIEIALWQAIAQNKKILEQISQKELSKAIESKKIRLESLLRQPELVAYFKDLLGEYLLENNNALIETLLKKYEFRNKSATIHLPLSLDIDDPKDQAWINQRILAYIESIDASDHRAMLYLDKIFFAKKLSIQDKTRAVLREKQKEMMHGHELEYTPMHYGIRFDGIEEEQIIDRENFEIVFNIQHLKKYDDFNIRFFYNLAEVFELLPHGSFAMHDVDIDFSFLDFISFKRVGEARKMAPYNQVLALMLYQRFLNDHHSSLEALLEHFYNHYLKKEWGIDDFHIRLASDDDYRVEKVQNILAVFEKSIEQMGRYLNVEMTNNDFENIQSQAEIKHLYPKDKDFAFYRLNMDQNSIAIKNGFLNLYDAVESAELFYDEVDQRSKKTIDSFIEERVLAIEDGLVVFCDPIRSKLYRQLYHYGVLVYPELSEEEQKLMREDLEAAYLDADQKLFSIQERDFLSFVLDHGFKLRQNYQNRDPLERKEKVNQSDYFMMLMLMIQVSLKFHRELLIQT